MKNAVRIGLGALAAVWLAAMVALVPQFLDVRKENIEFEAAFSRFSSAVVARDYQTAYEQCGPEFRQADSYEQFALQMADFEKRYGQLRRIQRESLHLIGEGAPTRWHSSMTADFQYERRSARFKLSFRKTDGRWQLYGLEEM